MTRLSHMTDRSEDEPIDRLGRIAAAMLDTGAEHPEHHDGDQAIIMLHAQDTGMIAYGGYDEDGADAFANMLTALTALAEANGMSLDFVPLSSPPGQG